MLIMKAAYFCSGMDQVELDSIHNGYDTSSKYSNCGRMSLKLYLLLPGSKQI